VRQSTIELKKGEKVEHAKWYLAGQKMYWQNVNKISGYVSFWDRT
jgi:hypothetical protein